MGVIDETVDQSESGREDWSGRSAVVISAEDLPGVSESASPEAVAAAHPVWAADMAAWGPWERRGEEYVGLGDGLERNDRFGDLSKRGGRTDSRAPENDDGSDGRGPANAVVIHGRTSSILDVAWRRHAEGRLADWQSLLAVSQWAGRGQLRRAWISPPGNLHAVLALPPLTPALADVSSLLTGWLLCRAFEDLGVRLTIKWPNDLLLNDHKVGGILIEERAGRIVAGVGVNLVAAPPAEALRRDHAVAATSLAQAANILRPTPLGLWLRLVIRARAWYESLLPATALDRVLRQVEERLAWRGRPVRIEAPGGPAADSGAGGGRLVGVPVGLAPDGGLRLNVDGRETTLYSGAILPY